MRIHTGLYSHPSASYSVAWVGRAIRKHTDWCRRQDLDLEFNASSMRHWERLSRFPSSWTFGTMLKFDSIRKFLDSPGQGDRFVWIDLDVYPTAQATKDCIYELGPDAFFAPFVSPTYCGYPGPVGADYHMYCKLLWGRNENKERYRACSSGMFMMSRELAEKFWNWLEKDHPVDSKQWWDAYYADQLEFTAKMTRMGNSDCQPYHFGSEEMVLERWLNECEIAINEIGCDFTHLVDGVPSKFVHYYGGTKDQYPED